MKDKIAITDGKGFQLTVGNYTISVQIGPGNYCANQKPEVGRIIQSPDCEIAIWTEPNQVWVTKKVVKKVLKETLSDDVMGWVSPLQVGKIITWMTKQAIKKGE